MTKLLRPHAVGLLTLFALASVMPHHANAADAKPSPEALIAKTKSELQSSDATVRQAAIGSLVHSTISGQLLAEMRTALSDSDEVVRSRAATAIGNLGADAVAAIPPLIAGLKSDSAKEARETAARALGRIGKAAPTARDQIVPALRKAAQEDADSVTRVVALGALAMVDVGQSAQIVALRKYLHSEDALTRMKAAHALGMLGTVARDAAPEIVNVLKLETDSHRRGYVARALGNTGDPASLPVLEEALKAESDPGAQGEMRGAISRLKAAATKP